MDLEAQIKLNASNAAEELRILVGGWIAHDRKKVAEIIETAIKKTLAQAETHEEKEK